MCDYAGCSGAVGDRACVDTEHAKRVDSLPEMSNEDAKSPSVESISWNF